MPHDPKPIPSFDAASASRSPRCHALIPCAGSGSRAGRAGPKQYEQLAGLRLVDHTLAAFLALPQLASLALVVAPDDDSLSSPDPRVQLLRVGGASRAASVHNGLRALLRAGVDARDWVLVHDAARCLVTPAQVNALIDACLPDAVGGLLALPLPDTLKAATPDGRVAATVPRADKWLAQTPQMFRMGALMHDIGLTEVPDKILLKTSPLTSAEQRFYELHCHYGVAIGQKLHLPASTLAVIRPTQSSTASTALMAASICGRSTALRGTPFMVTVPG